MACWKVTISGKGIRKDGVQKLAKSLKDKYGENVSISVVDDSPPESRSARLDKAMVIISDARSLIEELRDEMQEWYDNLPENFRQGDKGSEIETAFNELEDIISNLESVEGTSVEFPGMY